MNQNDIKSDLTSLLLLSANKGFLKKAVFSKPSDKAVKKMVLTTRSISDKLFLQAEYFMTDNKALHKNISLVGGDADLMNIVVPH